MPDFAVRTRSLGKRYPLGRKAERHDQLRFALAAAMKAPFRNLSEIRRLGRRTGEDRDHIWALRDLSLEVRPGEVVGVIGRNGAGKSTLLKILSRITRPTEGIAEVRGRAASLLEIGTGFHPELTGRENVYLNGSVLGMTQSEIERKFDEIVDFSGVERFLDTPVKRYSSGMYLRLAFAVAAHLESEILIIDEVLAVGDADFQKRCLGKMESLAGGGRTVLFVSHNLGAVSRLCGRAVWLEDGRMIADGPAVKVTGEYLRTGTATNADWVSPETGLERSHVERVQILQAGSRLHGPARFDQPMRVVIDYGLVDRVRGLVVMFRVVDSVGNVVFTSWDADSRPAATAVRPAGRHRSTCHLPPAVLRPARYTVAVALFTPGGPMVDFQDNVASLEVGTVGYPLNPDRIGITTPLLDWDVELAAEEPGSRRPTGGRPESG